MKTRKFTNLFIKLKKTKPLYRYIFIFISIIYLISIALLTYSLSLLEGIETFIRIAVIITLILYFIIYFIAGLVLLISKKHKILLIWTILNLLFAGANAFGYYYINKTYNVLDEISKDKIIYTTNLIKLKSNENEIKNVGLLSNENDIEGYTLPQEYMANNNLKYKITYYEDNIALLNALYEGKEDGIFITANYAIKYSDIDKYQNISSETIVVDSYSKKMDNQDTVVSTNKDITEPFTVLLLGVDSKYDGLENNASFNGDSIMLISFNPKTLSATVFSVPRDTYVPIACNNNKSYKINSASGYGTKCMIDTVEQLVDIPIDYYVKINFKGVVALVEALGGITVNVDKPDFNKNWGHDCKGMVCEQNSSRDWGDDAVFVPVGENINLNGEQALAYARNRHQWALSDFKRIEHQQAVVTAIANKAKSIRDINTLYKVLNAIANNIDTNMATKQILNFYNVAKNALLNSNDNEFINIQRTFLTGYDLTLYLHGSSTYTYQYYEESLEEIKTAMKENLEIIKPTPIKEFNFSVNEPYEVPVIGKKYYSVKRNETLPNFKDKTIQYVESWVGERNISLNKTYTESNSCINDTVLSQNVHSGTLVSTITNLTVEVCKNVHIEDVTPNTQNETNNNEQTNNNEENTAHENNTQENNKQEENKQPEDNNKPIDNVVENMVN